MKSKYIYEVFSEESDPIRDMGIGIKPIQILEKFIEDFSEYFKFKDIYYDEVGHYYDINTDDVMTIVCENGSHPAAKLLYSETNQLDFAMNNKAGNAILKGARWGWIYNTEGKYYYIKNIYDMKGVIKEIFKIKK